MSPLTAPPPLFERFPQIEQQLDELCLFSCPAGGFPARNIVGISGASKGSTFANCAPSFASLFSEETKHFFEKERNSSRSHYILLLTKDCRPVFVVTSLLEYNGLCLAAALNASPQTVLAFMRTMPNITYLTDPSWDHISPASESDPADYARLGITFRRLFSFFESAYAIPME